MVMSQRHTEPVANGRTLGRRASFWVLGFTVTAAMAVVPLAGRAEESSATTRVVRRRGAHLVSGVPADARQE